MKDQTMFHISTRHRKVLMGFPRRAFLVLTFVIWVEPPVLGRAEAEEATVASVTPITRQVLQLNRPVGRIFAGTSEALLAFDYELSEFQLIDAATGAIADTQKTEGAPLNLTTYYVGQNKWEFLYTQKNDDPSRKRFSLGILMSKKRNYFTSINVLDNIPDTFLSPSAKYIFGISKGGMDIITWDRSFVTNNRVYNIGGLRDRIDKFAKLYPYDLIVFRDSNYMLAITPHEHMASLLNVRDGYPEDTVYVEELSVGDPAHYSSFSPDMALGGAGTVVIANGEAEVLTVMSVIPGNIPQIDRPLQISLRSLSALTTGNRKVLVAANHSLSVILVGTVGSNELAVFRKVGGALEELKPVELNFPIIDIAVLPRSLRSSDNEIFVFLGDDKRTLQIEPDIAALIEPRPIEAHDPAEQAFPSNQVDRDSVARLQRALTTLGFSVGVIDGMPGRVTTAAVRAFQFKGGLKVTGVLDQETREALNNAVSQLTPADRSYVLSP
ncbi:peptidoglycan-binding domain-containing protein [Ensifer sp. Root278]|uniref:peptidoglycan-binding domain-containing protein n=1 Tax=Ensifer sp. Root278 TaxID=1736509 RepID=UPI00138F6353|nr:peptidoglycan-binding domain-containing protein [Ensifer sp. Root278]